MTSGWRAYRSEIRLSFGPQPPASHPRPGPVTDATDPELATLRRDVVEPVVTSVLSAQELEALELSWGVDGDGADVWVRLTARGELFEHWLSSPEWDGHAPRNPAVLAERLADQLEDWVCETRFAWGERRVAHFTLTRDRGPSEPQA